MEAAGRVLLGDPLRSAELTTLALAFGTVALSLGDWLVCIAISSSVLWLREASKLFVLERTRT